MKHPWIRVQDEDGSKPSFYTLAPTEEAFMSLLPAAWVATLGTPKVEFFLGNQVEIWLGVSTKETCESTRILLWGLRDWRIHRDRWTHNFACGQQRRILVRRWWRQGNAELSGRDGLHFTVWSKIHGLVISKLGLQSLHLNTVFLCIDPGIGISFNT